jgi:hypothetical protein
LLGEMAGCRWSGSINRMVTNRGIYTYHPRSLGRIININIDGKVAKASLTRNCTVHYFISELEATEVGR